MSACPVTTLAQSFPKEKALKVYEEMMLLRRCEEKAAGMYQQGLIGGFCHLYIGQEAVITGVKAATTPQDDIITSYRCHAHAIACGVEPEKVLAELTGREGGVSKGKGGSMHMFDPEKRFWGGHGIVGAQIPLGAGLAFAAKYKGENRLTVAFTGDGAVNQGQFFEALNMAALWKLPLLTIIENNRYGMGTAASRIVAGEAWRRAEPFGIPSEKIDGQNFFTVLEAVQRAVAHIRAGKGPYLLEMDTYRYRGHSMSDPAKYRSKEEVENVKEQRDPITAMGEYLKKTHGVSEEDLKAIDAFVKERVALAAEFAQNSPLPAESALYEDVMPA